MTIEQIQSTLLYQVNDSFQEYRNVSISKEYQEEIDAAELKANIYKMANILQRHCRPTGIQCHAHHKNIKNWTTGVIEINKTPYEYRIRQWKSGKTIVQLFLYVTREETPILNEEER